MKKLGAIAAIMAMLAFCVPSVFAQTLTMGDVNGDGLINIVDALFVARYDAGLIDPVFEQRVADVNGSGTINIIDALEIARYDAGLVTEFSGQIQDVDPPRPDPPGDDEPVPIDVPDEPDRHYNLIINCEPEMGGTVTGAGYYQITLPSTLAEMQATPTPGWKFDYWEGVAEPGEPTPTSPHGWVVMDGNKTVVAHFVEISTADPVLGEDTFILQYGVNPFGFGTVDVLQDPISDEINDYVSGARVRVTAVPASDQYIFVGWRGGVEEPDQISTVVVMDTDKNIVADFERVVGTTYTLTTRVYPDIVSGTVVPESGEFESGSLILSAIPADGYMFDHWEIGSDIHYVNPYTLTIDWDSLVYAHFVKIPAPPVTNYVRTFGIIASIVGGIGLVVARKWRV